MLPVGVPRIGHPKYLAQMSAPDSQVAGGAAEACTLRLGVVLGWSATLLITPSSVGASGCPGAPGTPTAPTIDSIVPGDGQAIITFTPGADNGSSITNYEYSLDGINYTAIGPCATLALSR